MHHASTWRNQLHIGFGILITVAIVAVPATYRAPTPEPAAPVPVGKVETHTWFGLGKNLELPGLSPGGDVWRLAGPLQFDETTAGTGHLKGFLVEASDPSAVLELDLRFRETTGHGAAEHGTASYSRVIGEMLGRGSLAGGVLRVDTGRGLPMESTAQRARFSLRAEWTQLPSADFLSSAPRRSVLNFDLHFAGEASWGAKSVSLELGGIEGTFELVAGGYLVEHCGGSAKLTAMLAQSGHPERRFHLELSAERNPDSGANGELFVDAAGVWRHYDFVQGALRGMDSLDGALLALSLAEDNLEVGAAGERGARQTAQAELSVRLVNQPDAAEEQLDLDQTRGLLRAVLTPTFTGYVFGATGDASSKRQRTFAMDLGELGDDFVFRAGGTFTEDNDGKAQLTGEIARAGDSQEAYYVEIEFGDEGAFAQLSSSRSSLEPWAFTENGGPVDRSTWRGYQSMQGKLTGLRARAGASLRVHGDGRPLQLGLGANGRSLTYGAFGGFRFDAISGTTPGGSGSLSFDLLASSEEALQLAGGGNWFEQLGLGLQLVAGGRLRQGPDGSARITGLLARERFPSQRMLIDLRLSGRSGVLVPGASPLSYFSRVEGELLGLEQLRGAMVEIRSTGEQPSMGLGVAGDGNRQGLQIPLRMRVVSQPDSDVRFERAGANGELAFQLSRGIEQQAVEAVAHASVRALGGHAFYLPGIATDFVFDGGGRFEESADGKALLEGRLVSASDPSLEFDLRLEFDGRRGMGQQSLATRSLQASAYVENGGHVDPSQWHSYGRARGILVGVGALAGSALELQRDGLALEVGLGANARNLDYGAAGEFDLRLLSQPVGDWGTLPEEYVWGELHINLSRAPSSQSPSQASSPAQ